MQSNSDLGSELRSEAGFGSKKVGFGFEFGIRLEIYKEARPEREQRKRKRNSATERRGGGIHPSIGKQIIDTDPGPGGRVGTSVQGLFPSG